jgi:hypothetical protein
LDPLLLLLWALIVGSTSAGMTVALRALPWGEQRLNTKPLACDVCMSFWSVGVLSAALSVRDFDLILVAGPAYPWALWVLRKLTDPRNPPPLPPLEDT